MKIEKELIIVIGVVICIFVVVIGTTKIQQETPTYTPWTAEEWTVYENVYAYCSMCVEFGGGRDCIDTTQFQDIAISHYCDYSLKIWHITLYSDYYTGLNGETFIFCY
jgi:hypothetical protein